MPTPIDRGFQLSSSRGRRNGKTGGSFNCFLQPQKQSTWGEGGDVGGPQGDETFTTVLVIGFSEIVKYNPIIHCNTLLKAENDKYPVTHLFSFKSG